MNEILSQWDFAVILLQIIAIDLLLGGDNAVVIAMACRKLPAHLRTKSHCYRYSRRDYRRGRAAGGGNLFTVVAVA